MSTQGPVRAPISVREVCEFIWDLERRLALLDWREGDAYPWPAFRMPFYYWLMQRVGTFEHPHPGTSRSRLEKLRHHAGNLTSLLGPRNPWFGVRSGRAVLIPSGRKVQGGDLYSDQLRLELGEAVSVLEDSGQRQTGTGTASLDAWVSLASATARALSAHSRLRRAAPILAVADATARQFGLNARDLPRLFAKETLQFLLLRGAMRRLLRWKRTPHLYLVAGYTRAYALAAARDCSIPVTELQHGTITPYHLGYSYPGRPQVPYAPQELLTFGRFWSESTELPAQTRTRVIGAPYVKRLAETHSGPRDSGSVVFSSQGVIGRRLFDFALETARLLPDRKVVFRLHPNERLESYETLLNTLGPPPGFSLSHQSPNVFALLASAEAQAGVFSTTLFEGMALGTRTILIDLPGVEYMKPVLDRGDAILVDTPEAFARRLAEAPLARDRSAYYADPVSKIVRPDTP
ncbi:MAG: hypothetical protein IT285_11165 [Bdellovibrionales bacterium]|nr:hypothetical protein [Bdellovibrionales bacterium]